MSLTMRENLVKIGAKVTRPSKYATFQPAGVAVARNFFATILDRIVFLAIRPPSAMSARSTDPGPGATMPTGKVCPSTRRRRKNAFRERQSGWSGTENQRRNEKLAPVSLIRR